MNVVTNKKIGIVGAGAIGAVLAQALYDAYGDRVTALADEQRSVQWKRQGGLLLNGHPSAFPVRSFREAGIQDLIFIAVKSYHLEEVISGLDGNVGEHTDLVSLLNGISSEALLKEAFGRDRVPLALAVGQDALRRDGEVTYTRVGRIVLGEDRIPSSSSRVGAIRDILTGAGIDCEVPHDMPHELWWKYMVNVGINQVSALLDAPYGMFQQPGPARDMMCRAMEEVRMVALREGIELTEHDVKQWLDLLDTLNPRGETSMLQDVRSGRSTELQLFAPTLTKLADRHGIPVPVNRYLMEELRNRVSDS